MSARVECALVGGGVGGLRFAIALCQAGFLVDPVEKQSERRVWSTGIIRRANAVRPETISGVANEAARQGWPLSTDQVVEDAVMVGARSYPPDPLRRWKSSLYRPGLWRGVKALRVCYFEQSLPDDSAQFDVVVEAPPRSMVPL